MLYLYVSYESNGEDKTYACEMAKADIHTVLMSNVRSAVVENELREKEYIFCILGELSIFSNNLLEIPRNVMLQGKSKVIAMNCKDDTGIFVETPANIFMMLDIIQKNEKNGNKAIRNKIAKYCKINHVHDYVRDYIVN
ncbi:MAG: hypothetical protein IJ220_00620 [Clostridia bacterium]|nr:hypothetical protein [Clostridia bacterium]